MTFLFYYANHAGAIRLACKSEGILAPPASRRASLFIFFWFQKVITRVPNNGRWNFGTAGGLIALLR